MVRRLCCDDVPVTLRWCAGHILMVSRLLCCDGVSVLLRRCFGYVLMVPRLCCDGVSVMFFGGFYYVATEFWLCCDGAPAALRRRRGYIRFLGLNEKNSYDIVFNTDNEAEDDEFGEVIRGGIV